VRPQTDNAAHTHDCFYEKICTKLKEHIYINHVGQMTLYERRFLFSCKTEHAQKVIDQTKYY